MILNFGLALGHAECGALGEGLSKMRFERSAPRESQMTLAHARAFIAAALKFRLGAEIGLSMAIGVATQFETMLRQKDVIGEWETDASREIWSGPYRWENIPGGIFRLKTSKTGAEIAHDLTKLDLLWPLIQAVPQADRTARSSRPMASRSARAPIASGSARSRKAEIPDAVWNMDARAGAVTEALEAGAKGPPSSAPRPTRARR